MISTQSCLVYPLLSQHNITISTWPYDPPIHVHHLISLGRRGVNVVIVWVRDRVKSARKITSCETYTDLTWLDSIHSPSHTIQLYQPPSLLLRGSVGWVCSATGISIYRYPLTWVVVDPPIANCSSAASARLPVTTSNQPPTHGLMMVIKWIVNAICSDQASQPSEMISPVIRKQYSIWVWNDLRVKLLPIRVLSLYYAIECLVWHLALTILMALRSIQHRHLPAYLVIRWLEIVVVNPPLTYFSPVQRTYMVVKVSPTARQPQHYIDKKRIDRPKVKPHASSGERFLYFKPSWANPIVAII